ncbi:MAG: hypothetical protein AAFX06_03745 [Planctomycetota bacterium]
MMSAEFDATLPFAICQELGLSVAYERSFKICRGGLLANRYLIGIPTADLSVEQARQIASRMGLADSAHSFWSLYPDANLLLIGFEDAEPGTTYKLYLEFEEKPLEARVTRDQKALGVGRLLHRGIKWHPYHPDAARVSDYLWQTNLDAAAIRERASVSVENEVIAAALNQIIDQVLTKVTAEQLRYVVVVEGQRRSFDLNVYAANLRVGEVFASCVRIMEVLGIAECADSLRLLVERAHLGHVAAGTDAFGQSFVTIYYEPTVPDLR